MQCPRCGSCTQDPPSSSTQSTLTVLEPALETAGHPLILGSQPVSLMPSHCVPVSWAPKTLLEVGRSADLQDTWGPSRQRSHSGRRLGPSNEWAQWTAPPRSPFNASRPSIVGKAKGKWEPVGNEMQALYRWPVKLYQSKRFMPPREDRPTREKGQIQSSGFGYWRVTFHSLPCSHPVVVRGLP